MESLNRRLEQLELQKKKGRNPAQAKEQIQCVLKKKEQLLEDALGDLNKPRPLCCGLFLETPSEMVYFLGGSDQKLKKYHGSYIMQLHMMKAALDHGKSRYNMWGISGLFEPDQQGYGVFDFKRRLGCRVGEYCGEFTMKIIPVVSGIYSRKLQRKGS